MVGFLVARGTLKSRPFNSLAYKRFGQVNEPSQFQSGVALPTTGGVKRCRQDPPLSRVIDQTEGDTHAHDSDPPKDRVLDVRRT
jgi:hypothetical protein